MYIRIVLFVFETGLLCNPGCPRTNYIDQAGLKLKEIFQLCPLSAEVKGIGIIVCVCVFFLISWFY